MSFVRPGKLFRNCLFWGDCLNFWLFIKKSCKLYLTSIGKVGTRLYIRKNGENFGKVCLLTLCVNKLIIFGQSQGLPSRTFNNNSSMFLFCRFLSPFDWGRYAEIMHCSVPIMLCKTLRTEQWRRVLPPTIYWNSLYRRLNANQLQEGYIYQY